MPIYAYKCAACGHQQDVLQKLADPALTRCPACGAEAYAKQLTAAGFQLKGSGWYVTDFRDGGKGAGAGKPAAAEGAGADGGTADATKPATKPATEPAAPAAAAAAPSAPAAKPGPATDPS
ncbi:MAG: zinc ribbon domain-containing protein [Rubrivivax sp.]|nr:zinc ribbon domain-containing protein [Rubrivivax sp.]